MQHIAKARLADDTAYLQNLEAEVIAIDGCPAAAKPFGANVASLLVIANGPGQVMAVAAMSKAESWQIAAHALQTVCHRVARVHGQASQHSTFAAAKHAAALAWQQRRSPLHRNCLASLSSVYAHLAESHWLSVFQEVKVIYVDNVRAAIGQIQARLPDVKVLQDLFHLRKRISDHAPLDVIFGQRRSE